MGVYQKARNTATRGRRAKPVTASAPTPPVKGVTLLFVGVGDEESWHSPSSVEVALSPAQRDTVKFAHVMRVLLAKWTTMLRLRKYDPGPSLMAVKLSWNLTLKGSDVILPYLPLRSPT